MFRFFRQIRQRLLAGNRFSKYLLYAVGEVLLVVIGILIAFQVDNWNEFRKTHNQDTEFLNNLKVELTVDLTALTERRSEYQSINDNIKNTIALFDRGSPALTSDEHREIVAALSRFQIFSPIDKNVNRNDLVIAQGTIDRIDKELNRQFLTYLQETQEINAAITKLGETLQQLEILQVHPNVDYNQIDPSAPKVDFDFMEIYKNRGVRNALQRSFGYRRGYIEELTVKIEQADKLIALIDTKLPGSN
ncbi:DUF6090 family protein [Robiginitalea sp. SC105]|uniref:DUF6090 family protein n=1 Tax=Robiginitalea sp. SC105 TaxID=2762332 RepID=UPI00163AB7D3|nr:DUF6090 family protein [Robiginitalea sp. SC105]MBC2839836.1 hypothetical protein [Robiginitalea sp. SC105]